MTGIDPAEVARKVFRVDELWSPEQAAEIIRAALEQAWDEGYDAGFYDRDFMRCEQARDASEGNSPNPYAKEGKS